METLTLSPQLEPDAFDDPAERQEPECELPPLDEAGARHLIRILARIEDERAAIKANAAALLAQLDREKADVLRQDGERLQEWVLRNARRGARSLTVLEGVAGFRKGRSRIEVLDPAQALAWARENAPAAVVETLDTGKLGKPEAYQEVDPATGEVGFRPVPGLHFHPAQDAFYVKSRRREGAGEDDE